MIGAKGLDRLPALALAVALPLPLASLPAFALGTWNKAEPMVVWLHACAALAALAVALALWRTGAEALARASHPVVLAPLALGLWSALAAPFCPEPRLSLLGAPQSGFGGLWWFDLAAFCAAARLASADRRGLGIWAIAVTLMVVAIKAWDWVRLAHGGGHLLLYVAGYYGWLALALPVAVAPAERRVALGVAAAVALASHSVAAMGALALGVLITVVGERGLAASRRVAFLAILAAAFLPLAALQDLSLLTRIESLRDRHLLHRVMEAAVAADSKGWLLGHGWGRSQDALLTWVNVSGEPLWSPTWTFVGSDYFHCHDWALEALYSAGLPGMLLTLAGFLVVAHCAPPRERPMAQGFAVAVTLLQGLWFQLSLSLPLMALAMAGLADESQPRRLAPPRLVAVAMVALALLQGIAAISLLRTGLALSQAQAGLAGIPPRAPAIFPGGDLAVAEMIGESLSDFARRPPSEPIVAAIRADLAEIDRRATTTRSVTLLTTGLGAMAAIHVTHELAFAKADGQIVLWRKWLDRLLEIAPGRSDQAIPFFTAALAQSAFPVVAEISAALLARNANDPVGLYYRGLTLAVDSQAETRERGRAMIGQSLDAGIERFMPIDAALKRELGR